MKYRNRSATLNWGRGGKRLKNFSEKCKVCQEFCPRLSETHFPALHITMLRMQLELSSRDDTCRHACCCQRRCYFHHLLNFCAGFSEICLSNLWRRQWKISVYFDMACQMGLGVEEGHCPLHSSISRTWLYVARVSLYWKKLTTLVRKQIT